MASLLLVDLETTGLDPLHDCIIEIAAILFSAGDERKEFSSLVSLPEGKSLPHLTEAITGIRAEDLENAPELAEVLKRFREFAEPAREGVLLGQNIGFDRGFLEEAGVDFLPKKEADTLFLAQLLLPGRESYALEALAREFQLGKEGGSHRALADCQTTAELFALLRREFSLLPEEKREALQATWRKAPGMVWDLGFGNWKLEGFSTDAGAGSPLPSREGLGEGSKEFEIGKEKGAAIHSAEEKQGDGLPRSPFDSAALRSGSARNDAVENPSKNQKELIVKNQKLKVAKPQIFSTRAPDLDLLRAFQEDLSAEEEGKLAGVFVPREMGPLRRKAAAGELPAGAAIFFAPGERLDEKKLSAFLAKEKFSPAEARFASKIFLAGGAAAWRGEVRLGPDSRERELWRELASEKPSAISEETRVLLVGAADFWREELPPANSFLAADAGLLLDAHDFARCQIFPAAGALEEEGARYFAGEPLSKFIAKKALPRQLPEPLEKLLREAAAPTPFLSSGKEFLREVCRNPGGEIEFRATPVEPAAELARRLSTFKKKTLGVPTAGGSRWLRVFGELGAAEFPLEEGESRPLAAARTRVFSSSTARKDKLWQERGLAAALDEFLSSGEERLLVLTNSLKSVEQSFLLLKNLLRERDSGAALLAEKVSGGRGKVLGMLESAPAGKKILLCRESFFLSPPAGFPRAVLIRVGFDHPANPLLLARQRLFANDFLEASLPRAAWRLARALPRDLEELTILDFSVLSKSWGAELMAMLGGTAEAAELQDF